MTKLNILLIITCIVLVALLTGIMISPRKPIPETWTPAWQKDYAGDLLSQELYEEAIDEYNKYLARSRLDDSIRANINYIIGKIYMDNLQDYKKAMAYFTRVKYIDPKSKLIRDINLRMVECLDRLDRTFEARKKLEEATSFDQPRKDVPEEEVIARYGDRVYTNDDLEKEISKLPEVYRKNFTTREEKLKFLRQILGNELIYKAAQRRRYNEDKEIIQKVFETKKNLMIKKYFETEVMDKVIVNADEMKLYYQANRKKFTEPEKIGLAHIKLSSKKKGEELLNELKKGADFAAIAAENSENKETGAKGGELGLFGRDDTLPGIKDSQKIIDTLWKLEKGQISELIDTGEDFQIFKVTERIPEKQRPFADVRNQIEYEMRTEKVEKLTRELIDKLITAENVKIFDDRIK